MVALAGQSHGTAKRVRQVVPALPNIVTMATVTCDKCGHHYAIEHRLCLEDVGLAAKQAVWLADKFVCDHIQEIKHHGSIRLPFLAEAKPH